MILLRGELYREKSMGTRTEPQGTPKRRKRGVEELSILTNCLRSERVINTG